MPLERNQQDDDAARALLTCLGAHGIVIDDARLARLLEGRSLLQNMLTVLAPTTTVAPPVTACATAIARTDDAASVNAAPSTDAAAAVAAVADPVTGPVVALSEHPAAAPIAASSASRTEHAVSRSVFPAVSLSLFDAAEQIRCGQLSPVALLEACLHRIAALDDTIHAFTTLNIARARLDAQRAAEEIAAGHWRGPLHGVPISIKDVIDVAGLPTLAQSRQRLNAPIPEAHSAAVAQLVLAGAVVIGKTTTHEYAFGGPEWTAPALRTQDRIESFGQGFDMGSDLASDIASDLAPDTACRDASVPGPATRNPWSTERFAGGSSSGAAASVACGMALGALGSDTAGSIRSPAALCGMTGFKPSRNHIERSGCLPLADSLDTIGVIAENAMDCALLFDALTSGHVAALTPALTPAHVAAGAHASANRTTPRTVHLSGELQGLKVGIIRHFFTDGIPISAVAAQHIQAALHVFSEAGATIQTVHCAPLQMWNAVGMTILLAEAFAVHRPMLRDHLDDYGHTFADAVLLGATVSTQDYQDALAHRNRLTTSLEACVQDYDVLIAPIQAGEAPFLADVSPWGFLQRPSYGIPFNLSDMPAVSLCCGFGANGLPLALQLISARGNDAQLLDAAYGFQMRTDWHLRHRQPPPHASTDRPRSPTHSAQHSAQHLAPYSAPFSIVDKA